MTDEIRRAMEARLAALDGSPERRARIRARIEALERKEEPIMKRKFSVATALVMAVVLLGGTALAAGLGLNLFEYFGRMEKDWANIAEKAVLGTEAPVLVSHETLGAVEAKITNAYYDGQKLLVAYMVQTGQRFDFWEPTEKQKEALEPMGSPEILREELQDVKASLMVESIRKAVEAGQPIGFIRRTVRGGDVAANGVRLLPYMGEEETLEDGTYYEIIDYATPLPEGVRDQASLALRMPLWQSVEFRWFDGNRWYGREETVDEAAIMTATVQRATGEPPEWTAK